MDFELDKPQHYQVEHVALTVDKDGEEWEPDQYGNRWYTVKFRGNAESVLWLAKDKPGVDDNYYGHITKTKSGKGLRFKRDQEPEDSPKQTSSSKPAYKDNSKSITLGLVFKTIAGIRGLPEPGDDNDFAKFYDMVKAHTEELILISEKLDVKVDE